jgi:hypothetical protein
MLQESVDSRSFLIIQRLERYLENNAQSKNKSCRADFKIEYEKSILIFTS